MPVTPIPDQYLSQTIAAMQRQLNELTRAVGRPSDQVRDTNDNVLHMVNGTDYPVWGAKDHDVSIVMANGAVAVADGTGRTARPITAQTFYGPVQGDTTGVHHGDVGVNGSESYNHYGDLHGNSFGFHYGPVGDGATQNQINALNVFSTGHFGTQHGDVGVPGDNWALYGHVIAPSERRLKEDVRESPIGSLVDSVPAYRWRWRQKLTHGVDEHTGPMVDDLAVHAPWLVRDNAGNRSYELHDLIGVLWGALRESRAEVRALEARVSALETKR
jgi:hypothetical protein